MRAVTDDKPASCRICGAAKGSRFEKHGFSWLRCARCASITKLLTPEEYRGLDLTYDPGLCLNLSDREQLLAILEAEIVNRRLRIAKTMAAHGRGDLSKASFLDVGCGMGAGLIAARNLGMDVLGFEPSAAHARIASDVLGLPVIADYFTPEKLEGRTFDLIMLTQVIEHIYDPKPFIHALLSALRPGGILQIATPNAKGLTARLVGRDWPMLRPADHVSMISSTVYAHFDLPPQIRVHHGSTEYLFDFAATLASALRSRLQSLRQRRRPVAAPAPQKADYRHPANVAVQRVARRAPVVLYAAAAVSLPVFALGKLTGRGACLVTTLVAPPATSA